MTSIQPSKYVSEVNLHTRCQSIWGLTVSLIQCMKINWHVQIQGFLKVCLGKSITFKAFSSENEIKAHSRFSGPRTSRDIVF